MNKKNLMIAGAMALGLGAVTLVPIGLVSAQVSTQANTTFVAKLAERLGISQDTVQTAVDSTKKELKTERDAQRTEAIAQAVTNGKLTQRQADILNKMDEARDSLRDSMTKQERQAEREADKDLTKEERKAKMETQLVDTLNQSGLNTNAEEVTATIEAAKNADILKGGKGGGPVRARGEREIF